MTYKIMIQTPITDGIKSVVESRDDVTYKQFTNHAEENILQHIGNYDAAILGIAPFTRRIIEKAEKLKIVARVGVGYDAVDVPALTEHGIPLAIAGIANSVTVAEHSGVGIRKPRCLVYLVQYFC